MTSRRVIVGGAASAVDLPGVAEPRFINARSICAGNSAGSRIHRGNDGEADAGVIRWLAHAVENGGKIQKQRLVGGSAVFVSGRVIAGRAHKSPRYWDCDLVGGIFGGVRKNPGCGIPRPPLFKRRVFRHHVNQGSATSLLPRELRHL